MATPPPRKKQRSSRSIVTAVPSTSGVNDAEPVAQSSQALAGEDIQDKHARLAREICYMELDRRFRKVKIHVNGENCVPKHVWYQLSRERHLLEHRKYAFLGKFHNVRGSSLQKWLKPSSGIRSGHLKFADLHIDHLAQFLTMEERRITRGWTLSEGSMDLPALKTEDHLKALGLTEDAASPAEFVACVRMAFLHNMHNSVGRDGLRSILEFAGKITFGPGFPRHSVTKIFSLGSSPYRVEGFPINVLAESIRMTRGVSSKSSGSVQSDTPSEDDTSKTSGSTDYQQGLFMPHGNVKQKPSHVFADTVVMSVDDDGWAKILMVCEVKSGYTEFHTMDNVKLVRQMVGACMHQNEVFGLLANAEKAKLVKLVHCPNQKQLIFFDQTDQYYFSPDTGDSNKRSTSFRGDELKRLLHDLVKVLSYAKEEIRKVNPLPDAPASN